MIWQPSVDVDADHRALPLRVQLATVQTVDLSAGTVTVLLGGADGEPVSLEVMSGWAPRPGDDVLLLRGPEGDLTVVGTAEGATWGQFTPTLTAATTNPTLGSGALRVGRWVTAGALVHMQVHVQFGTSGAAAGSGAYRLGGLPTVLEPSSVWYGGGVNLRGQAIGVVSMWQAATSTQRFGFARWAGTFWNLWLPDGTQVAHNVPWTWGNGDELHLTCTAWR